MGAVKTVLSHPFMGHWPLYEAARCEAIHTALTIEAIIKPTVGLPVNLIHFVPREQAGDLSWEHTDFNFQVSCRLHRLLGEHDISAPDFRTFQAIVNRAMWASQDGQRLCRDAVINRTVENLLLLCVVAIACQQKVLAQEAVRALYLLTDCVPLRLCSAKSNTWSVLAG